jgi:hypothetical protein
MRQTKLQIMAVLPNYFSAHVFSPKKSDINSEQKFLPRHPLLEL